MNKNVPLKTCTPKSEETKMAFSSPGPPYLLQWLGLGKRTRFSSLPYPNWELANRSLVMIFIPNRTFLVRFGGISGEFGRAMVRILARRSRAKIPMVRLNEPDMLPKRTKKVRLGIYRTQIRPKTRRYFFSYRDQLGVLVI